MQSIKQSCVSNVTKASRPWAHLCLGFLLWLCAGLLAALPVRALAQAAAPVVTSQPQSVAVLLGGSAVFSASAVGAGALSYQWRKDGLNVSGGAASPNEPVTYFRLSHAPGGATSYQRLWLVKTVNIVAGHTYQVSAVLPLTFALDNGDVFEFSQVPGLAKGPQMTLQGDYRVASATWTATASVPHAKFDLAFIRGANTVVEVGNVVLTDVTTGEVLSPAFDSPTLLTDWTWDSVETQRSRVTTLTGGSLGTTLKIPTVKAADAGKYDVVIKSGTATVTSAVADLRIAKPPVVTVQPLGGVAYTGGSYALSVAVTGDAPLSYQWRKNGAALSLSTGTTQGSLNLSSVAAGDAGDYDVVVTNPFGSATSQKGTVSVVNPSPALSAQTTGGSVLWGGSFTFNVMATGAPPLVYQWSKDGLPISDGSGTDLVSFVSRLAFPRVAVVSTGTSSSLVVGPARFADAGTYSVVVSNAVGSAASTPARLLVTVPAAGPFYVSPTGSDASGNGAQAKPFASLQKAIDAAAPGDTVNVLAGTYKGAGNQDLQFRSKNVKLIGVDGPLKTLVDCGQKMIATLENGEGADALLQGFTFFNAYKTDPYDWSGAALLRVKNSSPIIENCIFRDNAADGTFWTGTTAAGLIFAEGGEMVVRNCLIYKNRFKSGDNATFSTIFAGHFKSIENCTITENTLDALMINWWYFINKSLLRVFNTDATTKVLNCISWNNKVSVIGERREVSPRSAAPEVPVTTYSLAETLLAGLGNLSRDPLFKAAATADYSLTLASPALDAGDPASRRDANGTRADMGYRQTGGTNVPQAPVIHREPVGGTAFSGGSFTFSVTATGDAPLAYQWRKNGVPVVGGSSAGKADSFIPANLKASDSGDYDVLVTNGAGGAVSVKAVLNVVDSKPAIVVQPVERNAIVGDNVTLGVTATGAPALNYQWRKNGVNIAGGTLASGTYQVVEGAFTWESARVDALAKGGHLVTITSQAEWDRIKALAGRRNTPLWLGGSDAKIGNDARLEGNWEWLTGERWEFSAWCRNDPNGLTAENFLALYPGNDNNGSFVVGDVPGEVVPDGTTLHWVDVQANYTFGYILEIDPLPKALGAGNQLQFPSVQFADAGAYDVVVTNTLGAATSARVNLTVGYPLPVITTQPIGNGTISGGSVKLTAGVSGGGTLSLQWYKDGLPLPNATDPSLNLGEMKPWLIGDYTFRAENQTGAATSNAATLGMAGENPAIWKGLEAYYLMSGNARDTSPFQIHGTVKTGAEFGADRRNPSVQTESGLSDEYSLISAGTFTMGNDTMGDGAEHSVNVSEFYIGKTAVTFGEWTAVKNWADEHGYTFDNLAAGTGTNYPVTNVSWYDTVKWSNAKSEKEGLKPVYYTDESQSVETIYRSGQFNVTNAMVNWNANGYRLPTDAEWEKAARGGLIGRLYPNGDSLTTEDANFNFNIGETKPVKSYTPNGSGLYEMAGNVWQWCWDWDGDYSGVSDPKGPDAGEYRVGRGGSWNSSKEYCRVSYRTFVRPDGSPYYGNGGFRLVRNSLSSPHRYAIIPGIFGSFAAAKADAEARGGHLASITSTEEFEEVKRQIGANLSSGFFLGAYKDVAGGNPNSGWKWVTGEPFDFANWRGGEPNNFDGTERFVEVYPDWTWNDLGEKWFKGNGPAGYLIEFDPQANNFATYLNYEKDVNQKAIALEGETKINSTDLNFREEDLIKIGSFSIDGLYNLKGLTSWNGSSLGEGNSPSDSQRSLKSSIVLWAIKGSQNILLVQVKDVVTTVGAYWSGSSFNNVTQTGFKLIFGGGIPAGPINLSLNYSNEGQLRAFGGSTESIEVLSDTPGYRLNVIDSNSVAITTTDGPQNGFTSLTNIHGASRIRGGGVFRLVFDGEINVVTLLQAKLAVEAEYGSGNQYILGKSLELPNVSPSTLINNFGSLSSGSAGVSLPDSPLLTKARTFSLWAKLDSYAAGFLLFHGDTRSGYDPISIAVNADGRLSFGANMPAPNAFGTTFPDRLQLGVWVHLAGTVDEVGGVASFYVNGKNIWSGQAKPLLEFPLDPVQDAGWGIGNHPGVTQTFFNQPFQGSIDDVRFYNRVLSATEVAQLFMYEAPSKMPIISAQPLAGGVGVSGRFDLSVTAVGGDLSYQWRKNGVNIEGANGSAFSIASAQASDAGVYDVLVSNGFGSVTSSGATLTVSGLLPTASPLPGGSPFDYAIYVSKIGNDTTGTGALGNPFLTITKAVGVAPSDSRILVSAGTYSERVEFVGKTLRLHSLAGPALTTIQGVAGNAVVYIDEKSSNSELRGFRITGGTGRPTPSASGTDYLGGGVHCRTTALISDCIIDTNGKGTPKVNSGTFGGAIYSTGGELMVVNCLLTGNYAWACGGATYTENGSVQFDRCTVFGNTATQNLGLNGGLAVGNGGGMVVKNCIVYGNVGAQLGAFGAPNNVNTAMTVEYSDIQGTLNGGGVASFTNGTGNLGADPQFVDTTKLEFVLKGSSPALNAGNPATPADPDGSRADMGWRADRYSVETLIYVTKTGDDAAGNGSQGKPYLSIGKAIAAAPSGARIFVGPGIYAERVDYGAKTLRIHSTQGADFTTIVGIAGYSAVSIGDGSAYSELRGFRITGGQGSVLTPDGNVFCGGGVYCGVTAYISDCIISGNGSGRSPAESATYGGGIYSTGGAVTVVNCLIYDNFAWYNGGAVYTEEGSIELDRCTVSVNNIGFGTGQLSGVAVATGGKVEVRNSIVWGNGSQGVQIGVEAAPRNADTEVFVEYSDIEGVLDGNGATVFREGYGNIGGTSDVSGDPLFVDVAQANFALQTGSPGRDSAAPGLPSDEDGTSADMGWRAGRYSIALELYVSKSGNDTTGTGTLAKPYLTISKAMSVAPAGAWVLVGSGTYAERVQFSGKTLGLRSLNGPGSTTIQGGSGNSVVAIDSAAVNSRVQGFRITGGTGKPSPSAYGFDYYGGGVHCVTTAFLSDCIIDGNGKGTPRVNSATFGGAIYSGGGKLTVTNCLITGNYAWASGGATLTESGTIEFDRCTVQGNDATVFVGQQGGLAVANGGQMIVKNSIVHGNTGSQVGAFGAPYNVGTAITVEYSDIQGTIDGGGARSLTRGLGNIGAEPLFANIATKDFALKAGSPAIDTANPNAPRDNDGTRADMGWRQDRYYVGGALRKAPVLAVTSVPANASKVLLPLDSAVVIVSGTVTHESGVDSVVFERTTGTLKESTAIAVTELPPVLQGGKTLRVWEWSAELPFETFGKCDYAVYAVDQTNLKSAIVAGSFTAAQAARVVVVAPAVDAGTITVTPAIPANTLVEVGQTLQIVAAAKPGYLFRLLEVDVDGLPEDDITRSSVALVVKADTVITPQFIVNPFPALAGSWSGLLQDGWTSGLVTVTMGRTGAYSIRVVSGRNAFSFSGVMDASGRARIVVPAGFWPYSETKSGINSLNSSVKNPFVATLNLVGGKLRFSWGDGDSTASGYGYAELGQAVGGSAVTKLPSRRYTAALWRCVNTYMDPSNTLLDTGFFTADLTTSGAALGVGSAKVSDKVVRFSFSGNLIANGTLAIVFGSGAPAPAAPSKTLAANTSIAPNFGGGTVTGPILNPYARNFWDYVAVGLSLNYYAVTSSSDLVAHGAFGLNGTELRGPLSTRRIRTGALDPLADAPLETLSANEMDFRINGYPYIAPKVGQVPLPFVSPGVMSFGVLCGQLPLGTLSWTNFRPTFRSQPGSFSYAEELTLKAAALSVLATNGAFTGSMQTQRMDSGSAVTNRSLNGVLLQGGSQSGTGLSSDGLPVRIR